MKNFKKSLVSSLFTSLRLPISFLFPSFVVKTPILQKTKPLNSPLRNPQPPPPPRHYPFSPPRLAKLPLQSAPRIMEATIPFHHNQLHNLLVCPLNLRPQDRRLAVERTTPAPPIVVVSPDNSDQGSVGYGSPERLSIGLEPGGSATPPRTSPLNRLRGPKDTIPIVGKPPRKQRSSRFVVTEKVEIERLPPFMGLLYHLRKSTVSHHRFRNPPKRASSTFRKKLHQCHVLFDFNDASSELKGKQIKAQTLHEMLEYITTQRGVILENIYPEVVKMVRSTLLLLTLQGLNGTKFATNLFRSIPSL